MKITAVSHTYDGTGRAGFTPFELIRTRARSREGVSKAWSSAAAAEYARKLEFQSAHRATVEKFDALAINGVWIAEGYAVEGARRYRMTATAEQGGRIACNAYELPAQWNEYAAEAERIEQLRQKYATR